MNRRSDAATESMRGILGYTDPSSHRLPRPRSSIVDQLIPWCSRQPHQGVSWYDNEWGYSCRVADLCALMDSKGI
jgi:glyceraldehyde 3-phosphate dehydrogenase